MSDGNGNTLDRKPKLVTDVFSHAAFDNHEQVIFVSDKASGLRGIIGIHSTALGPAAGGCRMYPYASVNDALSDVLRLSRGMTMKNAAADLPLGGGKCVIIGNAASSSKEAWLRAMARHVARLNGRYWTAIDVGVGPEDADVMAEECDYVFARASDFEADLPPAHYTALGGFEGLRAATKYLRGTDDMKGLRVAIQGVGQTGADLVAQLTKHGAIVYAADISEIALEKMVETYGATAVSPEEIYAQDVDIFVPCAMGGVLNDKTISELKCAAIVGLANNQLERPEHGRKLLDRDIAYAPDFIVNAGGMIGCSARIFSTPNKGKSLQRIKGIYDVTLSILERSRDEAVPTEVIAEAIALERIKNAKTA